MTAVRSVGRGFLPPASWPAGLASDDTGALALDECDLRELAGERGTPLWVVSRATLEANFAQLKSAFRASWEDCELAYSVKANASPAVVRLLREAGAIVDASSEHELELALRSGVPPKDIVLNGAGKSEGTLTRAAELGLRQVNIDSLEEIRRLDDISRRLQVTVSCVIRLSLGPFRRATSDPASVASARDGKFGLDVPSGEALRGVEEIVNAPYLDYTGLHHHLPFSGYRDPAYSPERDLFRREAAARQVCELANEVRRRHAVEAERLNFGGGLRSGGSVLLASNEAEAGATFHPLPSAGDYAEAILGPVSTSLECSRPPTVQLETGGYPVWNAVVLLVSVLDVKWPPGRPRVAIADGSMKMCMTNSRIRYPAAVPGRAFELADELRWTIAGNTCASDALAEGVELPPISRGDVVALFHQGAYCEAESTQFNSIPRPEVILAGGGRFSVIKRRESLDDVLGRDRPVGYAPARAAPTPS